ncbi:MAG: type II toxin-antitoxin system RelE/ParE family toxin [Gammaproteobacteria bacterium]|nr:type II toxin-antitoxin system RelE/ParE family toxin [Gammaproteobacteria bacterium]
MAWSTDCSDAARRRLHKLDRQTTRPIVDFMDRRIARTENPRSMVNTLAGPLGGFWRYRAGNCRMTCNIQNNVLRVLVVRVGNRCALYR